MNFDLLQFVVLHLGGSVVLYPLAEVMVAGDEGILLGQVGTLLQGAGEGGDGVSVGDRGGRRWGEWEMYKGRTQSPGRPQTARDVLRSTTH